jgi:hypothetical protein
VINNYLIMFLIAMAAVAAGLTTAGGVRPSPRSLGMVAVVLAGVAAILTVINWVNTT